MGHEIDTLKFVHEGIFLISKFENEIHTPKFRHDILYINVEIQNSYT